jgi:hypothetical protein
MSKPLNLVVGALATALIAVGVAAQTGSIQLPGLASGHGSGAVQAGQATSSPSASAIPELSPSPPPEAAAAAAAVAPPPAENQPKHKKKHPG